MKNKLETFSNEQFGQVRAIKIEDDIWFVGKDVVEVLGYKINGTTSYTYYINKFVDEDEKKKVNNCDAQLFGMEDCGRKGEYLINESGMYALVFGSELPQAKSFKKWVTGTVLPTLRKDGMYIDGEENLSVGKMTDEELSILTIERLSKKLARYKEVAEKGKILFVETGKVYDSEHDASIDTGYSKIEIRNECRCVLNHPRKFKYIGATYNGKGELWIRVIKDGNDLGIYDSTGRVSEKFNINKNIINDICKGKIEKYNGFDFVFEEHEKIGRDYYYI